jgi:glycosyltransferase involved in cell wall biosynthesis
VRVLVFSKLFWPEGGGAELATYLVVGLLSRRFDVTVVSGTARPEPAVLRRARYLRWGALGSRFKPVEWLRLLAGARHIRRLLERADVVYIPSHTLLPLAAAAKRLRPGVKVVVHLHNFQPLAYTSVLLAGRGPGAAQDFLVERMEHGSPLRASAAGLGHCANRAAGLLALRCADAVVCVSRRRRDILLRYIPGLRGKTAVIYNPPPPLPGAGKELGGEPVFVYAGGSSYVKGFHVLLELLRKVARREVCRSCRFYAVAERGSEGPLKALSAALGGRLVAMDRMPRGEYLKLHKRAWGLLFPSICEEPLPYAVVESALLGTVPVASRVGGVPEVVEGTPAEEYLFAPGSVEELAEKVEMLASQPRERALEVGAKLRERALKLFDAEKIGNDIIGLFESLLSDR